MNGVREFTLSFVCKERARKTRMGAGPWSTVLQLTRLECCLNTIWGIYSGCSYCVARSIWSGSASISLQAKGELLGLIKGKATLGKSCWSWLAFPASCLKWLRRSPGPNSRAPTGCVPLASRRQRSPASVFLKESSRRTQKVGTPACPRHLQYGGLVSGARPPGVATVK